MNLFRDGTARIPQQDRNVNCNVVATSVREPVCLLRELCTKINKTAVNSHVQITEVSSPVSTVSGNSFATRNFWGAGLVLVMETVQLTRATFRSRCPGVRLDDLACRRGCV